MGSRVRNRCPALEFVVAEDGYRRVIRKADVCGCRPLSSQRQKPQRVESSPHVSLSRAPAVARRVLSAIAGHWHADLNPDSRSSPTFSAFGTTGIAFPLAVRFRMVSFGMPADHPQRRRKINALHKQSRAGLQKTRRRGSSDAYPKCAIGAARSSARWSGASGTFGS